MTQKTITGDDVLKVVDHDGIAIAVIGIVASSCVAIPGESTPNPTYSGSRDIKLLRCIEISKDAPVLSDLFNVVLRQ